MTGFIPQHMQATQMTSMYPQPMYGNQMTGYGYQMPGYGYGGYGLQQDAQQLEQRMYGMSVMDDTAVRGSGSSQTSMASYLPAMKKQSKGDDKLFGDLVDMVKLKPSNTPPGRTGSM